MRWPSKPSRSSCDLSEQDWVARSEAWRSLAPFVVRRERIESGFRVVVGEAAGKHLDALVALERSCCSWAAWSIGVEGARSVLEVIGPAAPMAGLLEAVGL